MKRNVKKVLPSKKVSKRVSLYFSSLSSLKWGPELQGGTGSTCPLIAFRIESVLFNTWFLLALSLYFFSLQYY